MNLKILAVGFLVAAGVVTETSAACNPPKSFSLGWISADSYWIDFPDDAAIAEPALKVRFWQGGNRAAANEGGACPAASFLVGPLGRRLSFYGMSGGDILGTGPCDNVGCVEGSQVILFQTLSSDGRESFYAVGKVSENADGFDYGRGVTDWQMVRIPRPRITWTSHSGTTFGFHLMLDPPEGAHGEADGYPRSSILTGYQIVLYTGTSDPGRAAAAWTNLGAVVPVTELGAFSGPYFVSCADWTRDVFLALRPVFDGGQFSGDYVSTSTRIECDPWLADPRFRWIDAPASRRGSIRSNRER